MAKLSVEEKRARKREQNRKWLAENREHSRAYHRQWDAENREKQRAYAREWHRRNPGKARAYRLKRKYGITVEQADALHAKQKGKCAICKTEARKLLLDHDHATGRIRGLLCVRCNNALGAFGDDAAGVRRALRYVTRPPAL